MTMLCAGLLAKNACEAGLSVKPHVKTSLMPGSGLVTHYLKYGHVIHHLERLGYDIRLLYINQSCVCLQFVLHNLDSLYIFCAFMLLCAQIRCSRLWVHDMRE
jgi:hypothetical protein